VDWQSGLVLACVILAVAYMVRATWLTWHPKPGGCGGGCGCKSTAPERTESFVDSEQIGILRRSTKHS
jgi:attachment p12 family protein